MSQCAREQKEVGARDREQIVNFYKGLLALEACDLAASLGRIDATGLYEAPDWSGLVERPFGDGLVNRVAFWGPYKGAVMRYLAMWTLEFWEIEADFLGVDLIFVRDPEGVLLEIKVPLIR